MNILRKGKTPNNTDIQIEDWSINYPNSKSFIIGFYPVSKESIYREDKPHFIPYPKRGETFRCAFEFETLEEAITAFEQLESGIRVFSNYLDYYFDNVVSRENFVKCVIA